VATAITYRTGEAAGKLRTVLCDEVRAMTVLLPAGSLSVITAKLLHGQACRHNWWAEILGTDPSSDDFAVPSEQVVQARDLGPVKTKRNCH
jgi:hypothetical protein